MSNTIQVSKVPKTTSASNGLWGPWGTIDIDLLAVSCQLYRLHSNDPVSRFTDLPRAACGMKLEQIDHDMADSVCQHFGKQIMLAQLRGEVTDFQRAVAEFIKGGRRGYYASNTGLIYRLPEYYENDLRILEMRSEYFSDHEFVHTVDGVSTRELRPIKSLTHNTRNAKSIQYWFTDVATGNPVRVDLDSGNKLRYLWEHFFESGKVVPVNGYFMKYNHALGFDYMNSKYWKLEIITP